MSHKYISNVQQSLDISKQYSSIGEKLNEGVDHLRLVSSVKKDWKKILQRNSQNPVTDYGG